MPQADAGEKIKLHCALTTEPAQQTEKPLGPHLIRLKINRKSGNMKAQIGLPDPQIEH